MPHLNLQTLEIALACVAVVLLFFLGYRLGRWIERLAAAKDIARKEQDLFTTQKGFKALYEQELETVRKENEELRKQIETAGTRVEEYRRKAAGFGGLFNSGGKRADAMYALLLENEALEEALFSQNEKLKQERTDALREQLRATNYRRVLMSQLLNDERIKGYVAEILADEKKLPAPQGGNGQTTVEAQPAHPEG